MGLRLVLSLGLRVQECIRTNVVLLRLFSSAWPKCCACDLLNRRCRLISLYFRLRLDYRLTEVLLSEKRTRALTNKTCPSSWISERERELSLLLAELLMQNRNGFLFQ